ncbi:HlyD family efflux transporter periplasmic adaptor subunit [Winogradskyella sp.]|uniref:HlyD family secretion protein n=1 Tax=Winogradskyella sp. TaxID=1883156 RepID=UPI002626B6E9|nr:HlyD family efflux transporter periplasmic adaptor subunit [Winogradskyella sp.]
MNPRFIFSIIIISITVSSCGNGNGSDAYGNFEATTITVSAKGSGELEQFNVSEGDILKKGKIVGIIDTTQMHLEKLQLIARLEALDLKLQEAAPEIAILLKRKSNLTRERNRTKNLLDKKAATQKQLDDFNGEIDVVNQQIASTQRSINISNRSILSERKPLEAQIAAIENIIADHTVSNPINGTVITTFVEPSELVSQGTPLYKVANLDTLTLRAYTSALLLQDVKLNDTVTVLIDEGEDNYKELDGKISWIASESEFTPKTIQTKEERVNLVYAIDVEVKNDGALKIGMPGEVKFSSNTN